MVRLICSIIDRPTNNTDQIGCLFCLEGLRRKISDGIIRYDYFSFLVYVFGLELFRPFLYVRVLCSCCCIERRIYHFWSWFDLFN